MLTLRGKINETEPGQWANFLTELLYHYSIEKKNNPMHKCGVGEDLVANPAHTLRNLVHYLECLAFDEVAKTVEKEEPGKWRKPDEP